MKNNRTFLEKLLDGAEVEWKPLDKVANIVNNARKPVKSSLRVSGNIPYYGANNIQDYVEGYTHEGEFVLIAEDGSASLENYSIQWAVGKFWANNHVHVVNGKEKLNNRFLYHYLTNMNFIPFLAGKERAKLTKAKLQQIPIPIPPLSVQTEIVKILDALTALTSELTSELILRQKQYEYYREKLLSFDSLEQLNSGGKKKLIDVVNIYLGLTYTPTYVENGVKFISAQNTSNDFLDLSNTKFISREEFEKSTSNAKPKRGDILFTRVGSNLGHPVIVDTDEDLCIFVSLGFLRVKDKNILNSYIKHWMNTNLFWKQVEKNVHGSAKVNLNTGWLKNFEIYIPPLEEQHRIVSILDKFETLTNSITEGLPLAIEQSQKRYEYYRELLLNFS